MNRKIHCYESHSNKQNVFYCIRGTEASEVDMVEGSADGLRPNRRGPRRGESVGGVCPDDEEWDVRQAKRERTLKMRDGRG